MGVIDMEVNYLKLGEKVYAISEIQAKDIDINVELKEFYDQRHQQLADEFGQVLNNDMQVEWDTQIAHLRKFDERGSIKVPENLFGKLLMVKNNRLLPVRVIIYSPDEVSASISWLRSNTNIDFMRSVWNAFRDRDVDVAVTIIPPFAIPLVMCYDSLVGMMYTPTLKTYHTMYGDNVCTGRNKASDFWKLSDENLQREMNRINTFSPATSVVRVNNTEYSFRGIINNATVTAVHEREVTQWRV